MTFTPKDWQNYPSQATPRSADAMIDLETRLSEYTDAQLGGVDVPALDGRLESVESSTVGVLNAAGFSGVDRSGVSDSTSAMQAAWDAAAGGSLMYPFGSYKATSGLVVPAGGLTLILDDAELNFSGAPLNEILVAAAGALATAVNVNAVVAGALSITGSAGIETGINAGDFLKLRSTDVFDPGRTSSLSGELVKVLSTASGVINVRTPVMGSYSTGVQISKITTNRLVLKGTGQITGGGSGSQHIGIQARQIPSLRVDVTMRGVENVGVQLYDCHDFDVVVDCDGANFPQGYGVSMVNACQWGRVHNSFFKDCRHSTSINNANGTDLGGIGRHITVESNEVRDSPSGDDAIDTHSGCEYISIIDNDVYDSGNVGINVECNKATVKNNRIYRPADNGIYLLPCSSGPIEYDVSGNKIYDGGQYGIRFAGLQGAGATTPKQLEVVHNYAARCAQAAVYLDPSAQTTSPFRLVGARMSHNRAEACGASGTVATFYMAKADAFEAEDNIAIDQPNGLVAVRLHDCTKGKWNGNIGSFTSAGTVAALRGTSLVGVEIADNIARQATGVGGNGLRLDGATSTDLRIHDNDFSDATTPYNTVGGGTGCLLHDNKPGIPLVAVASAATITLPGSENDVYSITGTTGITSITATNMLGRVAKLIFTGILTVTDGSNLKLNGNLTTAAQTTLLLVCDGTNWQELTRSVN